MSKKGYFYLQKQSYPPWLRGPCLLISCTSYVKGAYFELICDKKGGALSLEYVVYLQGICIYCVQADLFIMPVLSLYRSIIIQDLYTITRHNALGQFYSSACRGFFIYCNLMGFVNLRKIYHFFHFFTFFCKSFRFC
jgi:hypothetical protein